VAADGVPGEGGEDVEGDAGCVGGAASGQGVGPDPGPDGGEDGGELLLDVAVLEVGCAAGESDGGAEEGLQERAVREAVPGLCEADECGEDVVSGVVAEEGLDVDQGACVGEGRFGGGPGADVFGGGRVVTVSCPVGVECEQQRAGLRPDGEVHGRGPFAGAAAFFRPSQQSS
jgi:hypothetical protein